LGDESFQKQPAPGQPIIFLSEIAELRRQEEDLHHLHFGAAVPLEDAWSMLAGYWPSLAPWHHQLGKAARRHSGTLVGSLVRGAVGHSSAPALVALGASLLLRRGAAQREILLQDHEQVETPTSLMPGEWIEAIRVPLATRAPDWHVLCVHSPLDSLTDRPPISVVAALRCQGERISEARIAWQGLFPCMRRASRMEQILRKKHWGLTTALQAQEALQADYLEASAAHAITDGRIALALQVTAELLQTRPCP
jgi:xanthine dehydrogenase small subunit